MLIKIAKHIKNSIAHLIDIIATIMAEKTEKKLTGLQMPLNISPELAKIIGTKKGEQVCNVVVIVFSWILCRCPGHR